MLGGGGYLRGIGRMPDVLGGSIFLGAWVEGGSAFDDWDDQDWKSDITGGVILETSSGSKISITSQGIEITNGSASIKLTGPSVSVNSGALEVT